MPTWAANSFRRCPGFLEEIDGGRSRIVNGFLGQPPTTVGRSEQLQAAVRPVYGDSAHVAVLNHGRRYAAERQQWLAAEAGLTLDVQKNFQEYVRDDAQSQAPALLKKPGALNYQGTLSAPEWEVMRLYQVLQFTKTPKPTKNAAGSTQRQRVPNEGKIRMEALKAVKAELGADLPPLGQYAAGVIFFPRDPAAIAAAFEYDDQVLIERFIPPGREIRVGVLELADGSLRVLPAVEYFLTEDHPIRLASDKLLTDTSGNPSGFAKPSGGRKCPADVSAELMAKLGDAAIRAHKALGARDYSIYDMRVDPQGDVFFLESSLFCSFAPSSVIMLMAAATDDLELNETFRMIVRRAASRSLKGQEIDVTRTTMKASRAA